ncbi:MAG: hypothetical protein JSS76_20145 [Bacteroidetes bacterium]|nr:hypothetical protein [Bacteroidota bacterium]
MRKLTLVFFLVLSLQCMAAMNQEKPIYLKSKHAINITVTNAVSYAFYNSPSGPSSTATIASCPVQGHDQVRVYYPAYTFAIQAGYSYRITHLVRMETGLTYMLYGQTMISGTQKYYSPLLTNGTLYNRQQIGYLTIPIRVAFVKYVKHNALKINIGPELSLPLNKLDNIDNPNLPMRTLHNHSFIKSAEFVSNINLGLAVKAAWGVPISDRVSLDIGPVFDFNNMVAPDQNSYSYHVAIRKVFTYYAGLDVAFSFSPGK